MSRRTLEIETLTDFDIPVRQARSLNGWFISSLDLTERSEDLLDVNVGGAVFLGCALPRKLTRPASPGGAEGETGDEP